MGRKNRRRPFQCPVRGCAKRGLRTELTQHASALHPDVTREAYLSALDRGVMIGPGDVDIAVEFTPFARWSIRIVIAGAVLLACGAFYLFIVTP